MKDAPMWCSVTADEPGRVNARAIGYPGSAWLCALSGQDDQKSSYSGDAAICHF